MGFVSKKHAQDLLMSRPPGTFLLRFSDTELGGISIVYNCVDPGMFYYNVIPLRKKCCQYSAMVKGLIGYNRGHELVVSPAS